MFRTVTESTTCAATILKPVTRHLGSADVTVLGWHRINGATNIGRANGRADRRSDDLIHTVTSGYPRTQ
jgi:hypothetical protein